MIAQASDATALDRTDMPRALCRGFVRGRRFESILQDGYHPGRVQMDAETYLLGHVVSKKKYANTHNSYCHKFWSHLTQRAPPWPERQAWIEDQARAHDLAWVTEEDEFFGVDLGILPYRASFEFDGPYRPLSLDWRRFATLDGLLLLLLLYRTAQDLAQFERVQELKRTLSHAAAAFCATHGYQGEVRDTWKYLVETRMTTWNPTYQPSAQSLSEAEAILLAERANAVRKKMTRGPAAPSTLTRGRSERRWRRQIWAKAAAMASSCPQATGTMDGYRVSTSVYKWIASNRHAIRKHLNWANVLLVIDDDDEMSEEYAKDVKALGPLAMPEEVYNLRKRPPPEAETERIYGDRVLFDLVPVVVA